MGIKDKVIDAAKRFDIDKTFDTIAEKTEKAVDWLDKRHENKLAALQRKLVSKNPGNGHLWFHESIEIYYTPGERSLYQFYDMDHQLMYTAKARRDGRIQKIKIRNAKGKHVAEIKEKLVALRHPLSFDDRPTDFEVTVGGKKLGLVQSKGVILDQHLFVKSKKWKIYQKMLGKSKIVDAGGKIIAEYTTTTPFNVGMLTFVDYRKSEDELLIVTFTLLMEAYTKSMTRKSSNTEY